jgi:hypothetical protein
MNLVLVIAGFAADTALCHLPATAQAPGIGMETPEKRMG